VRMADGGRNLPFEFTARFTMSLSGKGSTGGRTNERIDVLNGSFLLSPG